MENGPVLVNNKVYPSCFARAAKPVPIVPPAPPLFSTINGWFRALDSFSPTVRAIRSPVCPAGKGTIIDTGFSGYRACAQLMAAMLKPTAHPYAYFFILVSCDLFSV